MNALDIYLTTMYVRTLNKSLSARCIKVSGQMDRKDRQVSTWGGSDIRAAEVSSYQLSLRSRLLSCSVHMSRGGDMP